MEKTTYPLAIPYGVVLSNVAQFNRLMDRAERVSRQIEGILAEIEFVVTHIQEAYLEDLGANLATLRVRIRQLQRGAPVRDADELDTGPEVFERSLVESQSCVRLWKRLVQRIHPDKGGDPRTFAQATQAFKNRDLRTLQYIWDAVVNFSHPGWKSTNVQYAQERLDHLNIHLEYLKATKSFSAVKSFRTGRVQDAVNTVRTMLEESILNATLEFQVLVRKISGESHADILQSAMDAGVVVSPYQSPEK